MLAQDKLLLPWYREAEVAHGCGYMMAIIGLTVLCCIRILSGFSQGVCANILRTLPQAQHVLRIRVSTRRGVYMMLGVVNVGERRALDLFQLGLVPGREDGAPFCCAS